MISRRRIVRSPRFETAPSLCLPPVDFSNGVRPSQAAKARPAGKFCGAGTSAVIAVETIGPTPGIVISRRAVGSAFERQLQNDTSALRQAGLWVIDEGDQGCKMGDALWK